MSEGRGLPQAAEGVQRVKRQKEAEPSPVSATMDVPSMVFGIFGLFCGFEFEDEEEEEEEDFFGDPPAFLLQMSFHSCAALSSGSTPYCTHHSCAISLSGRCCSRLS